ncbi:prenyltransferase/squalene oxidase repeat-containing protein [Saccharothrix sp. NRRL B-16348]|uniref:prenyltransferase/squalene oxidase repeat-containing protein n=1 Tax=Saccharothrix sp. NRRL B-16348 TaxID=1415542 RepID=UPI0009E9874F|nr:prenyltransferase/squalene oxidase repeat-containing protein [Saccharothrix sp. NRRL B-16348]
MSLRRTAAVLAAAAVAALAVLPAAQSQARVAPTTDVSDAAAGWLARQLVDGDHFENVFDGVAYPDQGLTLDALFAFTAAGVASDSADEATAWLAEPAIIANYLHFGDPAESYAGAHAKLALAVQARDLDPTGFGGEDLIAGLTALQAPSGRFSDKSQYGDYSNGFTQAFAVLALDRWEGAPQAAVDYLVGEQCADGGFPLILEAATCVSHVDATAMVVQALLAVDKTAEAAEALDWLTGVQQAGGGFRDEGAAGEGNANSTGLAAQALRAGGRTAAADKATRFLTSLQVGCTAAEAARGAIAFDKAGFTQATSLRASAQGVLGLVGVNFADLTAAGDTPDAPVLDCGTTTTSPTSSSSSTSDTTTTTTDTTTTTSGATATSTTTTAVVAVANNRGTLARTGAAVGPALWIGALLLVGGVLAVVLARRRYAEARK